MILRDYQNDSIDGIRSAIKAGHKRILLQASTGAGKTVIASAIIESAVKMSNPVLFVAHRKEIIEQTSQKLDSFGIDHGVIMADHYRYRPKSSVQVASIQTLSRRAKPAAKVVIIDECHLSCSKSFTDLIALYPDAIILGLTATPTRLDGKGLRSIYTHMVQVVPMRRLIDDGHLVQPRIFAPFMPDMSNVATVAGDFDQQAVASIMDKTSITGDIITHWKKYAPGRKTIIFASSVSHSEHLQAAFLADGISARHVDAKTPSYSRDNILKDWRAGKFDVLTNCGLFIEGLDVPEIGCCILARPTQSLTIYLQAVGRAMRPAPGKNDCIILDHAGLTHMHGLIDEDREWNLDGKKKFKRPKNVDDDKPLSVAICKSCFAAFSRIQYPETCPQCGTPLPLRLISPTKQQNGELVELTKEHLEIIKARKKQEVKSARSLDDLVALARSRGYKNPEGWAQHILDNRIAWKLKHTEQRYARYG